MNSQPGSQNSAMLQASIHSTHSGDATRSSRPSRFIENFLEDSPSKEQRRSYSSTCTRRPTLPDASSTPTTSASYYLPSSGSPVIPAPGELRQPIPSRLNPSWVLQPVRLPTPEASVSTHPNPSLFAPNCRQDTRQLPVRRGNINTCRLPTPPPPELIWPELGHPTAGPSEELGAALFQDQDREPVCPWSTDSASSQVAASDCLDIYPPLPPLTRQPHVNRTQDIPDSERLRSERLGGSSPKKHKPPSWSRIKWTKDAKESTQLGLLFAQVKHWVCRSLRFGSHKLDYLRRRAKKVVLADGQERSWDDVAPHEEVLAEVDVYTGVKVTVTTL